MSFFEFEILLLVIAVVARGLTDALLSSDKPLSQSARRVGGSAAALFLIFVSCLNLSNVVPAFSTVATQYLMIHPDAQAQGKVFADANLGIALMAGVQGAIGLLLSLSYEKPD